MQKTYKNSTLIQGLLIAPIPLLMCVFIYIFITDYPLANNYESGSHFQFLITMIIASYLIFILIISPIIFVVLYLLKTKTSFIFNQHGRLWISPIHQHFR